MINLVNSYLYCGDPTLSLGISLSSDPCLRKTLPAVCWGLMPIPSSVMIALVAGGTLNSSAANFRTAVKGVASGTDRALKGSLGSEVRDLERHFGTSRRCSHFNYSSETFKV